MQLRRQLRFKTEAAKQLSQKHQRVLTNQPAPHAGQQYSRSITIDLESPSNFTGEIIKYAIKGLDIIFKDGYNYLKCGVIAMDIVPHEKVQASMFDACNRKKNKTLMETMDKVNKTLGKEIVRLSVLSWWRMSRLK